MNLLIKILLTKLIELLCKKAEEKFLEAKSGGTKKAYVINQVDKVLDINDKEAEELKEGLLNFTASKIEEVVFKLFNKNK